jgi:hypothetical protein
VTITYGLTAIYTLEEYMTRRQPIPVIRIPARPRTRTETTIPLPKETMAEARDAAEAERRR